MGSTRTGDADPQIYLASRSPRRAELLAQIGIRFALAPADTDETPRQGESPRDYVSRVALDKARAAASALGSAAALPVLAADTAVVSGDRILGKPRDEAEALAMLRALSGSTHRVLTGVCLAVGQAMRSVVSESQVSFRPISEAEMRRYWQTGEPCDKAGGYAIQGLGALFVTHLRGSYSGVMGLPLCETGQLLERAGIGLIAVGEAGA
ncbi:septum formation inhibitor Maf [Thiorhodococcus mannitoliphagus]|uniref:dTTP/UTP pyrophosphatase n=1 Tax=Thiorhodococcus mannitoliphagus TaxID=329406 RepID=A0A6P1DTG7_9GAMM|nr:nucleoside triphosphate pyrophosphatase [Thiorhodococcus mannitoliphagus]NEX21408.1 septum formation inhibitor Maf [Thiorhodococcus mannitoliphagus]